MNQTVITVSSHPSNSTSPVNSPSPSFPLWQITFPFCIVLIVGIMSYTAIKMVDGRFNFNLIATRKGVKLETEVDKSNSESSSNDPEDKAKP